MKTKLGALAELQIGYQARGRIEPDPESPYRVLQVRDVDDRVDWTGVVTFRPERQPDRYRVREGDILVPSRGGNPVAVLLDHVPGPTLAAGNFYILRVRRKGVLPGYLAWYINQAPAQTFLRSRSQGTNIAMVAKADLEELEVPVPALAIQEKVVRVAALQRRERELLRDLEERRGQLIQAVCLKAIGPKTR
jgi:hypothetical protein